MASRKHVVAVGDGAANIAKMLDVIDEATYWNVNITDLGRDTVHLSDLAITSKYVVVTSLRDLVVYPPIKSGRLWYLHKPTTPGAPLFPGSVYYGDINNTITGKYCIKARSKDEFVTAFKEGMSTQFETKYYVSYHNGLNYWDKMYFKENEYFNCSKIQLRDIAIEPSTQNTVVLVSGVFCDQEVGPINQSIIYEIPYPMILTPGSIYGHVQDDVFLTSLDVSHMDSLFSSGYSSAESSIFDKLKNGMFSGSCFGVTSRELFSEDIDIDNLTTDIFPMSNPQLPEVETIATKYMEIETICDYTGNVTDEESKK